MGKLFLYGDLREFRVVKDVMEENNCRIPLTEERWLRVANALPDAVAELGKLVETDCAKMIKDAARQASRTNMLPAYIENDDEREIEEGQDRIPICLLSATAIFKHDDYGYSIFDSYTEILRKRTLTPSSWVEARAWGEAGVNSTGAIVATASLLLAHLRLPKETTMSYMLACGCDFRCLRCSRISGELSMTWPKLVQHFIQKLKVFEDLHRRKKERNCDVPLLNDHDLEIEMNGKLVSRARRTTVDLTPTGENAGRYSALSTSWGRLSNNDDVLQTLTFDHPDDDVVVSEAEDEDGPHGTGGV